MNDRIIARGSPVSRHLEWGISAIGCRPTFGTEADFLDQGSGRAFAQVKLEPGWGVRVLVQDRNEEPVAGASVLVDGRHAGSSDAAGRIDLRLDEAPGSVEVDHTGWRARGHYPPVPDGSNPFDSPWYVITLERERSGD